MTEKTLSSEFDLLKQKIKELNQEKNRLESLGGAQLRGFETLRIYIEALAEIVEKLEREKNK